MTSQSATRFLQRLDSFSRAFSRLDRLVKMFKENNQDGQFSIKETGLRQEIANEALLKRFDLTQDLSWKILKDYLTYQGETGIIGARDTYRRALQLNLIDDPAWFNMIKDRQLSAYDFDGANSKEISERIITFHHPLLMKLLISLTDRATEISSE